MQMRWKIGKCLLAASVIVGSAYPQQPKTAISPSPGAQLVRVRIGNACGMCTGPYYESETVAERGSMVSRQLSRGDKRHYPDMKMNYRITKQDWEALQLFIDASVLAAFVGPIGCPGCVDQPIGWVEVQFSDGTKKSVSYNEGSAPPVIAELLKKIRAIKATPMLPQK